MKHTPVLLKEVLEAIGPRAGGYYIDATLGEGGHSEALLRASKPNGRVLSLDQDPEQVKQSEIRLKRFHDRFTAIVSKFSDLDTAARQSGFTHADGILFDLGVSSRQIEAKEYGLTFEDDAPLDMRLSRDRTHTAANLLNELNEREIADLLYRYGDRHNSRTLARKIVTYRRNKSFRLAQDLKEALGLWRPNLLAPIFQALRIAVNQEFEELEAALPKAIDLLSSGGVIAVISFHSGEDRIVKQLFRANRELIEVPKHIIRPTLQEIRQNPRARSAILRYGIKKSKD